MKKTAAILFAFIPIMASFCKAPNAPADDVRISWDLSTHTVIDKIVLEDGSVEPNLYYPQMTEPVAAVFAKKYRSPERLEDALIDLARKPVKERVFAKYYAAPGSAKENSGHTIKEYSGYIRKTEGAEKTPTPVWYDSPESEQLTIPVMKEGMTDILITGDAARNKIQTMPGAGLNGGHATIEILLPKNWDTLMAELGYEPLENFKLKGVSTRDEEKIRSSQGNEQRRKPEQGSSEGYRNRPQNGNNGMDSYQSRERYNGGYRNMNGEFRQRNGDNRQNNGYYRYGR